MKFVSVWSLRRGSIDPGEPLDARNNALAETTFEAPDARRKGMRIHTAIADNWIVMERKDRDTTAQGDQY